MKQQFKLYRRNNGRYYAEDTSTGKQSALGTRDKAEANRLLHAQNEAAYQPAFNKQMAKTYLAAGDPRANTRTWQDVMGYLLQSKEGRCQKTRERYESAIKDPAFNPIRNLPLIHTTAETLYKVLKDSGKPRDRSHFEHFRSYHQSIYRWVEPTSVTPFAVPVRERALHAQLVTLARYWGDKTMRENPNPPPNDPLFKRIRDILIQRIEQVDSGESAAADLMLTELIERWRRIQPPIYGHFGSPPQETPLMYPSGTEPRAIWANRSKATPSSMRNVDSGCDAEVISQFQQP